MVVSWPSPTRETGCAGASSTRRRAGRHRRRRDGADARGRRAPAGRARLVRHRIARRGRRARSMSASSACIRSCGSTTAGTACWRAGSRSSFRRAIKTLPKNQGIEGLVVVPRGLPLAGALIAISERALDDAGNILRLADRRAEPRRVHRQAQRRFRHHRRGDYAGRRSACPRATLFVAARGRDAHPPHSPGRA